MSTVPLGPESPDRDAYWRRKLRRLRLGAEPVEVQVARYRRATIVLTAASAVVGLMFLAIFAAFERLDVGLAVAGVILVPVVALAWLDFAVLRSRASAYLAEQAAREPADGPPG